MELSQLNQMILREWRIGLRNFNQIKRFTAKTLLGIWLGLGTHP